MDDQCGVDDADDISSDEDDEGGDSDMVSLGSKDSSDEEEGSDEDRAGPAPVSAAVGGKRARKVAEGKPARKRRLATRKAPKEHAYVEYTLDDYAHARELMLEQEISGDTEDGGAAAATGEAEEEASEPDTKPPFDDLPDLSDEQREILECAERGENIVLLGKAGSGKSVCVKHIINAFTEKGKNIGVFSYVGSAASIIRGCTLNSALRPCPVWRTKVEFERNILQIEKRIYAAVRRYMAKTLPETDVMYQTIEMWRGLDILIIDEISTCSPDVLYALHVVANACRHGMPRPTTGNPMIGGLPCIMVGDMCQLAPIPLPERNSNVRPEEKQYIFQGYTGTSRDKSRNIWGLLNLQVKTLKHVFRQDGDNLFLRILDNARMGQNLPWDKEKAIKPGGGEGEEPEYGPHWSTEEKDGLRARIGKPIMDSEGNIVECAKLYCRNADCKVENDKKLDELPGEPVQQSAVIKVKDGARALETLNPDTLTREKVISYRFTAKVTEELLRIVTNKTHERHLWDRKLKVGALVVLTQNTDFASGLVNGSVGTILTLDAKKAEVRFKGGVHTIERRVFKASFGKDRWVGIEQMPLWCCWAMTVHRSQVRPLRQPCLIVLLVTCMLC